MIRLPDYVVVFDFETSGLNPANDEAVEVAGKAYVLRTLEPVAGDEGEFASLMRPANYEKLDYASRAFKVNGITRARLEAAPDQAAVWPRFVEWVANFNPSKKEGSAPLLAGKNCPFDVGFLEALNKKFTAKKEKTVVFNKRNVIDLEQDLFRWHAFDPDFDSISMDAVRPYYGLSSEGAHGALMDVRQEGALVVKFLKFYRTLRSAKNRDGTPFVTFKDACKGMNFA